MTNATLRGKSDAGNPHVRFDEGDVASAKPRRGSLLYGKLRKIIGEGRAIFASVLCLLTIGLLAPSALAESLYKEYVCTDNQWETERNPFALPTSMPHWISALCFHDNYTNYQGYVYGIRGRLMHGTWFLGTNTYYCVSQPRDSKETPNPIFENSVRVINWRQGDNLQTTPSDRTCLAQIQRATETALKDETDPDTKVGKNVSLALCKLLRPHELEGESGTAQPPAGITLDPSQDQNGTFFSNLVANVGVMYRAMSYSNPLAGQCLDGHTFYEGDKTIGFDCYRTNNKGQVTRECTITPKEMLKEFDKYYGPGLKDCISTLSLMPDDWIGTYLLHNRDYKKQTVVDDFVFTNCVEGGAAVIQKRTRTVTHPDAWPMFDEDVNLDRADVLLLKFACHALDTAAKLAQSYRLPTGEVGRNAGPEIRQFTEWQENFHSVGYSDYIRAQQDEGPDNILHCGIAERIECAVHSFFHDVPFLLETVDDSEAMAAARASFVSALECFLDADAFVTGTWPSETGHNFSGQRDTAQLHLFEFAEPEAGENGGEWNIAGYRELARKAYASLMGKGTEAAVQTVDLVQLGQALDIHAGSQGNATDELHGVLDFSGLGPEKDGKVAIDLNPLFAGTVTPRSFVTDVDGITTNGPTHWVENRFGHNAYRNRMRFWPTTPSNLVGRLLVNVSTNTVSPTLCGVYPSGTFVDDIKTMSLRYPEDGGANRAGFSKRLEFYASKREEIKNGDAKVLDAGATYTAKPTDETGGVFDVGAGGSLTGKDVTFKDNSADLGGAICNAGTVTLDGVTFEGNKSTSGFGGAIFNAGTVNLDGTVTLKTETDTLFNVQGTVNWNLTEGKAGRLDGYDKLGNEGGTLQLTVDGTLAIPTNVVIATGDFTDVSGKDTFIVTNVFNASSLTLKIGTPVYVGEALFGLSVSDGKLVFAIDWGLFPVAFNAMGGIHTNGLEVLTNKCFVNKGYELPTVEREGYAFAGWYEDWKAGAASVTNGQPLVVLAEHSLYAQWAASAPTPTAGALTLPDLVAGEPNTAIAKGAYSKNTSLVSVVTPLYLSSIGDYAFNGCTSLRSLTVTASRDYETLAPVAIAIGRNAFSGCAALEDLMIAGEVGTIGQSAFQDCTHLKKIVFRGDSAIGYGASAFFACGYRNGLGAVTLYMSSAFKANNAALVADLDKWFSANGVKIVEKVDVTPATSADGIYVDFGSLGADRRLAVVVKTNVAGTPDTETVDIEYAASLTEASWTVLPAQEKTAFADGSVMVEVVVPQASAGFLRAKINK